MNFKLRKYMGPNFNEEKFLKAFSDKYELLNSFPSAFDADVLKRIIIEIITNKKLIRKV